MFYNAVISSTISFGTAFGVDIFQNMIMGEGRKSLTQSQSCCWYTDNFKSLYRGKVLHKAS